MFSKRDLSKLLGVVALGTTVVLVQPSSALALTGDPVSASTGLAAAKAGPTVTVSTVAELESVVNSGAESTTVDIAPGRYELTSALRPRPGMTIRGAGAGKTTVTNAPSFAPGTAGLADDSGAWGDGVQCANYLFDLGRDTANFTFSDLTLTGPKVHGGVCGIAITGLDVSNVEFKSFLWSGVRAFILTNAKFHDNTFINAGGKTGITTGSSGGGLFLTYLKNGEIWDNRFSETDDHPGDYYGVKGREFRDTRIHHNNIDVFFSVELPFEEDWNVEIDSNYLGGAISIPRNSGGKVPDGAYGFHIHHNYFRTSYALEYQRNNVEIDHNLFDFELDQDYGNLISGFDVVPAPGGTRMHDNLINNPGLGLYWNEGVYNNFEFYNNSVRGSTTVTPRTEGLFEFRPSRDGAATDFSTIKVKDNTFELTGTPRPLMRNSESDSAVIENNTLTGISDSGSYANPNTGRPRGPLKPLKFALGVHGEQTVDGWTLGSTGTDSPAPPDRPSSALITPVKVSANLSQVGNGPERVLDGDLTTRWSTPRLGTSLKIDLTAQYTVDQLNLAFYRGDLRGARFRVEVSVDGKTWTSSQRLQSSGTSTALQSFTLTNAHGRYLRLINDGNDENNWGSLTEMTVQGTPA